MKNLTYRAALLITGNEILSGRTQDANLRFLAQGLGEIGIKLYEVRVVADIEEEIILSVNELRRKHDFVFTSGGIGPTHDDITAQAIAKAFGDKIVKNEEAAKILIKHYGEGNVNEARMKMAMLPSTASLLDNPVSSAPGFRIGNVFVMAGIPKIFQAMFFAAKKELPVGSKTISREIIVSLTESIIAQKFSDLQNSYPKLIMGSYPFNGGTSLVISGENELSVDKAYDELKEIIKIISPQAIIEQ